MGQGKVINQIRFDIAIYREKVAEWYMSDRDEGALTPAANKFRYK